MLKEPLPPKILESYEKWFAEKITCPLKDLRQITNAEGAEKYLIPSPSLAPKTRIEIYAQQYWWRLIDCMHHNFPSLTHFLGTKRFNDEIALPYLFERPPSHWSLNTLGSTLPEWMGSKRFSSLHLDLVNWDARATSAFFAKQLTEPLQLTQEALSSCTYTLQPHMHFIQTHFSLGPFREALLAEENPPAAQEEQSPLSYAIFRNRKLQVEWNEIDAFQYTALQKFKTPCTLADFCGNLESNPIFSKEAERLLPLWFQQWTALGWLAVLQ